MVDSHGTLPRLVGCMTDAANDVSEHLADISYPAHITTFLRKFERQSFGMAGIYRKHGKADPGAWCYFTVSKWVKLTKFDKYQLLHIRKRLADDGILSYLPNQEDECDLDGDLADGRLIWNLDFSGWIPLQPGYVAGKHGGARQGAGRPKKQQATIANLNTEQGSIANLISPSEQQATIANLNISDSQSIPLQEMSAGQAESGANGTENVLPFAIRNNSSLQCLPADDAQNYSKFAMAARCEDSPEAAAQNGPSSFPKEKKIRRKKGELPADQDGLPGMGFTDEEQRLLDVLRELSTCQANSKQDAHLIRALVYTNQYPIPWLIRQADLMIAWALRHPGKRKFDQGYFIQWCGFNPAQEDLPRWKLQQEALQRATQQPAPKLSIAEREQQAAEMLRLQRAARAAEKEREQLARQNGRQEGGY